MSEILLKKRKALGNFRSLQIQKNLVDFTSNDYLGLAYSETLRKTTLEEWEAQKGIGSTGSRLLTGNSLYIEQLENDIAEFHGFEKGILFNCGYMANMGLASSITTALDTVFFDTFIHASTKEGLKLGKAQAFPFYHNDLDHLEKRLRKRKGHAYIFVESLYSTDGSIAPLKELAQLAYYYDARLIVDEAHAVGVFGKEGKGLVHEMGVTDKVFALVVTFGKALGTFGSIVLGNQALKDLLINFATPFIYTTALPTPILAAIKSSYNLLPQLEQERKRLRDLINRAPFSSTQIQPIPMKGNEAARAMAHALADEGYNVRALLSPTVQQGKEILRLTLHAFNSASELENLLNIVRICG